MITEQAQIVEKVIYLPIAEEKAAEEFLEIAPMVVIRLKCAKCDVDASTAFQNCQNCGTKLFPF